MSQTLDFLSRGDLAGFVRAMAAGASVPSAGEGRSRFTTAISGLARGGDVTAVRRIADSAAHALLDSGGGEGRRRLTVPALLPLVEVLIGTGSREWPTTPVLAERIRGRLSDGLDVPGVLSALLVGPPHRWGLPPSLSTEALVADLRPHWARLVCQQPKLSTDDADADAAHEHTRRLFASAGSQPGKPESLEVARCLLTLPLYFQDRRVVESMRNRAALLTELARPTVRQAWDPPANRSSGRIRIGILSWDFAARTETYTTLPVFSHLPPSEFEVRLLATAPQLTDLPAGSPPVFAVPTDLVGAAAAIRSYELDVLVHGTNLTVAPHLLSLLATCRLARKSVTFFSSPLTTGLDSIDCYVSGELSEMPEAAGDYTEQLRLLPGAGYCSGHRLLSLPRVQQPERSRLGLPEGGVVFSSGAVVHKLSPVVRRAWARVLSEVPGSVLLVLPFAPNWDQQWPVLLLRDLFAADFAVFGVDSSRLRMVQSVPSREHVVALLRSTDVYLDSFPYTGANSVIDALEAGLPTVVLEGRQMRCRQAAALLRSAGLDDLVAGSAEDYVSTAVRLANDRDGRLAAAARVREVIAATPLFLNPAAYSAQCAELFRELAHGR